MTCRDLAHIGKEVLLHRRGCKVLLGQEVRILVAFGHQGCANVNASLTRRQAPSSQAAEKLDERDAFTVGGWGSRRESSTRYLRPRSRSLLGLLLTDSRREGF